MNKKLTTIMLAALLILIGKVDAATLTQKIGDSYISQTVNEGQQVRLRFVDQTKFLSWEVESGNVTIDTTSPTITFTMPSSDVVIRGVYDQGSVALASVAEVGAYVTYKPSSTSYTVPATVSGYTSDQTYNPSNTTNWRVFSVDGNNVEIISTDSIGDLSLKGRIGYINAVQTLNDMSASFANPEYATSGRSLGYYDETRYTTYSNSGSAMTETEKANYKAISASLISTFNEFPNVDYQYRPDHTLLSNDAMYRTSGCVWLASRYSYHVNTVAYACYCVRYLESNGSSDYAILYTRYSGSGATGSENVHGYGVRPVISLKSGITVTGSGTQADPYVINTSNPSQYTITYGANSGYGEMNPQSVAQGSSLTLSTNTYAHHNGTFLGWSTSATATTTTYTNGQTITPTADMTLYAVWEVACNHEATTKTYETLFDKNAQMHEVTEKCNICNTIVSSEEAFCTVETGNYSFYTEDSCIGDCFCTECGYVYDNDVISHDWVWSYQASYATCQNEGENVYECSYCHSEYSEYEPTTDHVYFERDRTEPIDGNDGEITYQCVYCGDSYSEIIPAT